MPIRLENASGRPVRLDLPSGRSLRLSPGQISPPLAAADVANSARVDRLVSTGAILVRNDASPPLTRRRGPRATASAGNS